MQYIYIVNTLQNSFFNKLLIRATISEAFLGLATSFYRITPFDNYQLQCVIEILATEKEVNGL